LPLYFPDTSVITSTQKKKVVKCNVRVL